MCHPAVIAVVGLAISAATTYLQVQQQQEQMVYQNKVARAQWEHQQSQWDADVNAKMEAAKVDYSAQYNEMQQVEEAALDKKIQIADKALKAQHHVMALAGESGGSDYISGRVLAQIASGMSSDEYALKQNTEGARDMYTLNQEKTRQGGQTVGPGPLAIYNSRNEGTDWLLAGLKIGGSALGHWFNNYKQWTRPVQNIGFA